MNLKPNVLITALFAKTIPLALTTCMQNLEELAILLNPSPWVMHWLFDL